ncbi:MAG: hypothetical protein ACRDE5_06630, partial [Ginsengibacter sp.]
MAFSIFMDKYHFIKLLHKYLRGKSTKQEQVFVEKYYGLFQNEPDVLDMLTVDEIETLKNNLKEHIWNNIDKASEPVTRTIILNNRYVKLATAAAAIIVMLISSIYILKNRPSEKHKNTPKQIAAFEHIRNRVIFLPDGSRVILGYG